MAMTETNASAAERAEESPIPETRGVRYEISERATKASIAADLERVAEAGFNTVIVSAFRHGYSLFPCEALAARKMPRIHPAFRRRDPLAELFGIAGAIGLSVLGHFETLNVGTFDNSTRSPILRRRPAWGIRRRGRQEWAGGSDGRRCFLDPANRDARRLIGDIFYELAERYPISGVYLNDLRYPRGLGSAEQSRAARDTPAFLKSREARVGRDVIAFMSNEPGAEPLFDDLRVWRNQRLNWMLRNLHCRLERASARIWIVTQAVGPYDGKTLRDTLQGDWGEWVTKQYVDAVAPIYKCETDEAFAEALRADYALVPVDRFLYPLLDAKGADGDATRVDICREQALPGFFYRSFHDFTDAAWEAVGERLRRPARPVEEEPFRSARWSLAECRRALSERPELTELFNDLLKVLPEQPGPQGALIETPLARSIIGNLKSLESRIDEGAIRLEGEQRAARRWIALTRRCLALAMRH